MVDLPWTVLDQRHGTGVVRVERPGDRDGAVGDVAVTDVDDAVLGCWTADCAPVVLIGVHRVIAIVHAGWRGLAAGVVDVAVEAMTEPVGEALLGPTIGPCCYEFGDDELAAVADGVRAQPSSIAAATRLGRPALDVPAAVAAALGHHGVVLAPAGPAHACTGCEHDGYSHRVRRDAARHVVAVWRPSNGGRPE